MWTPADAVAFLKEEARLLFTVRASDRTWQMPLAAALASGLPLFVGAWFGHLDYGLVSSLGGQAFLYLPATPLHHRMVALMAAAFALTACYALGAIGHQVPALITPVLVVVTVLVLMLCRFYRVVVPGALFFVMAAAIGAYTPTPVVEIPLKVGLLAMGTILATVIAFFYSLQALRLRPAEPIPTLPPPGFDAVILEPLIIGLSVGAALACAQLLHMNRPYWVPVSCLAIIQGASLRAVWTRQLHRILGTALGMVLTFAILTLPLGPWSVALVMTALTFIIETAVVRHYAFAAIFITPLTILLADATQVGRGMPVALIEARFLDTCLGCLVGLGGGACLHAPRLRAVLAGALHRLVPARLRS